mgnify:CR=1 FL=1
MLEAKQTIQTTPSPEQTPETEQLSEKIGGVAMQASESSNEPIQQRQRISDGFILSTHPLSIEGGQVLSPRKTPNTKYVLPKRK